MQVHPGTVSRFCWRQFKVTIFVYVWLFSAHGLTDPGQDSCYHCDILIDKDQDGRLVAFNRPEFNLRLVIASRVESDRDVFSSVLVYEENPPQQYSPGIAERGRDERLRGEKIARLVKFLQPLWFWRRLLLLLLLLHVTSSGGHRWRVMRRLPFVQLLLRSCNQKTFWQ